MKNSKTSKLVRLVNNNIPLSRGIRGGFSGQMLVVALLIMSIMAIVGASVATQVVNEQRRVRIEERTEKAFYAAEAGIEKAIEALRNNPAAYAAEGTVTIDGVNVYISKVDETPAVSYEYPYMFTAGTSAFFNLEGYLGTPRFCWVDASGAAAAVYIQYFYKDNVGNPKMKLIVSHPQGQTAGITASPPLTTGYVDTFNSNPCGNYVDLPTSNASNPADFIVFWIFSPNAANVTARIISNTATTLPAQGRIVTAVAKAQGDDSTTISRRVRRFISTRRYPPAFSFFGLSANDFTFGPGRSW